MAGTKFEHISGVIRELEWLDASSLVKYHRICVVHAAIKPGAPEDIANLIGIYPEHQYEIRNQGRELPQFRNKAGRRQIAYNGVQEFNRLPFDTNVRNFRTILFRHLLRAQHNAQHNA